MLLLLLVLSHSRDLALSQDWKCVYCFHELRIDWLVVKQCVPSVLGRGGGWGVGNHRGRDGKMVMVQKIMKVLLSVAQLFGKIWRYPIIRSITISISFLSNSRRSLLKLREIRKVVVRMAPK